MRNYLILFLSIVAEVVGTAMLKMSEGFTNMLPSIGAIAGYAVSFISLAIVLKPLPLSIAYAIWAGAGTALTALIGILIWGEAITFIKLSGLLLIIGGVILLNISKKPKIIKEPPVDGN
ncbi:multidrug efflux SMR transporter [Gracilibacillus sp. YIM 98692]|uniref:DMT family transporter n=1 Tax=Gracilibacillus sp. YIM 98692 TaxID=2663532 RepID=UPI0013D1AAC6|nr:multidrug efflux SMR transporter [Gracilibacillus sp. YIM 98692]